MSGDSFCKDHLHKEYPKQFKRDQFWNQIKRTVNGKPVSEKDIQLIVDQIVTHLGLQPHNHVLDLGCGNGALAARFFAQVQSYTGVDFSRYLLDVAEEFFLPNNGVAYVEADIRQVEKFATTASKTDKVLIYGCIAYLTKQETATLICKINQHFGSLETLFVGNIPNKLQAEAFFAAREIAEYQLDCPDTPIGVWWEPSEFLSMAREAGLEAVTLHMPEHFFGGKYRFDAVLRRRCPKQCHPAKSARCSNISMDT